MDGSVMVRNLVYGNINFGFGLPGYQNYSFCYKCFIKGEIFLVIFGVVIWKMFGKSEELKEDRLI